METTLNIFRLFLPLAYAWVTWTHARLFFSEQDQHFVKAAKSRLYVVIALHSAFLFLIAAYFKRCPLGTWGEGALFWAWMVVFFHIASEMWAGTNRLGFFTLLPITLGVTAGSVFLNLDFSFPPELRSSFFIFHIVASLSSYACFSVATVLASMYLLLYRKLKNKNFDHTFRQLPPLEKLDKLSAIWCLLGSITMTISSLLGWWWVHKGDLRGMSLHEFSIYLVLIVFAGALIARRLIGLRGQRFALIVLLGFFILLAMHLFNVHGYNS